ncbi:MAG: sensor histidine kinase [Lachnospiraceae bacterium]
MIRRIKNIQFDIQSMIMAALTLLTVVTSIVMGLILYNRYEKSMQQVEVQDTQVLMKSTVDSIERNLKYMRQISNTINFNVIQELDVSSAEFNQEFGLLYEMNKDQVQSMALYDGTGKLIVAEPVTSQKEDVMISEREWFVNAVDEIENIHFSLPHIQNLFDDDSYRYHRVVSLSRFVDIIDGGTPGNGVLLVDMKYSSISEMLDKINKESNERYYYLCDSEGNMIFHPHLMEMSRGLFQENSDIIKNYEDGIYEDIQTVNKKKNTVIINTISYTGWKLVGVVPQNVKNDRVVRFRYYIITIVILLIMMLLLINKLITRKISSPILKLDDSVKAYEAGGKPNIYIGGSSEIRHLGKSVQKSYEQIEHLMKEIVEQQNERRKSELDALQSQINPHFLYNTLESITWMIEGNKNKEAVFMISELAKLFRISLSKGKTIISIEDEIQHCRSYMNIQKHRYKERFAIVYDIDERIYEYCTVKLILQPILENAIYYGVGDMDEDDDAQIIIRGRMEGNDIYLSVEDNGMGMREEDVRNILTDNQKVPKHGSGVGLINVHTRIQLMFGVAYGLAVESEADEGTTVTVHLPAILFTKENCEELEKSKIWKG